MGAYSASKAAVEALGNTLRAEIRPSGARAGVAYFAELDRDMTSRGFDTKAAKSLLGGRSITRVTPLKVGIDALERGIARRSRIIVAPAWVRPLLPIRMVAQPVVDLATQRRLPEALRIARDERVQLTTPQPAPERQRRTKDRARRCPDSWPLAWAISWGAGRVGGTNPPNLFLTLGRNRNS